MVSVSFLAASMVEGHLKVVFFSLCNLRTNHPIKLISDCGRNAQTREIHLVLTRVSVTKKQQMPIAPPISRQQSKIGEGGYSKGIS